MSIFEYTSNVLHENLTLSLGTHTYTHTFRSPGRDGTIASTRDEGVYVIKQGY
jgi:hypothetical protein